MWQEIITYAILAITFGTVIYKSIIRPIIRAFRPKGNSLHQGFSPMCASCSAGISCENCAFYNPRPATYRYKNVKSDSALESEKDPKTAGIGRANPPVYTAH